MSTKKNNPNTHIWFEKYRPRTIDDIRVPSNVEAFVREAKETENIAHLLFVGKPGIGKTSLAKIIVNDILECQYLYINASDENGIDTIRSKVITFAQTKSLDGKIKVVILDECDGLTQDSQKALRNVMEEHHNTTRFILTANFSHKIINAITSRCQTFDLTVDKNNYGERLRYILREENIDYRADVIEKIIEKHYPDFRLAINELQKNCSNGKLDIKDSKESVSFMKNLFVKILKKNACQDIRQFVIENEEVFSGDYPNLLRSLFNYINECSFNDNAKRRMLGLIAEHLYRCAFVMDQEINFYACVIALVPDDE